MATPSFFFGAFNLNFCLSRTNSFLSFESSFICLVCDAFFILLVYIGLTPFLFGTFNLTLFVFTCQRKKKKRIVQELANHILIHYEKVFLL